MVPGTRNEVSFLACMEDQRKAVAGVSRTQFPKLRHMFKPPNLKLTVNGFMLMVDGLRTETLIMVSGGWAQCEVFRSFGVYPQDGFLGEGLDIEGGYVPCGLPGSSCDFSCMVRHCQSLLDASLMVLFHLELWTSKHTMN